MTHSKTLGPINPNQLFGCYRPPYGLEAAYQASVDAEFLRQQLEYKKGLTNDE